MKVSDSARRMIEGFEGCRLTAYLDIVGVPTIGYGHTKGVHLGQVITQAQADQMLADDLERVYGAQVEKLLRDVPTTQAQFDAMVSLAYNIGSGDWLNGRIDRYDKGGFEDSSILKHHLRGEYDAAAASFALWNKAGGRELAALTRRRAAEARLYLSQGAPAAGGMPEPQPVSDQPHITPDQALRETQAAMQRAGFYLYHSKTRKALVVDGDFGEQSRIGFDAMLRAAGQPGI